MSLPATTEWESVDQIRVKALFAGEPPARSAKLAAASARTLAQRATRGPRPRFVHSMISMSMAVGGLFTLAMRVRRRTR